MSDYNQIFAGLISTESKKLQDRYGKGEILSQKIESFVKKVFHIIYEWMFLLLIVAVLVYFFLGELSDDAIMLICVIGIISVDITQGTAVVLIDKVGATTEIVKLVRKLRGGSSYGML